ncbi:MAG: transposase, partial [Pseudomonadota bacterium]
MVDGTSVRAPHSATTLKKTPPVVALAARGRFGTKIHALTNQDGLPIRFELTPGQAHDAGWIRDMIWEQGAIDGIASKSSRKLAQQLDADISTRRHRIER